jgi:hypothetical protein
MEMPGRLYLHVFFMAGVLIYLTGSPAMALNHMIFALSVTLVSFGLSIPIGIK